jgi:hypothetical protein
VVNAQLEEAEEQRAVTDKNYIDSNEFSLTLDQAHSKSTKQKRREY